MTRFLASQLATAHWFDQRRVREVLEWAPRVSLDEGFARLAEHGVGPTGPHRPGSAAAGAAPLRRSPRGRTGTPAPSRWPAGAHSTAACPVARARSVAGGGGSPETPRQVGGHVAEQGRFVVGADVEPAGVLRPGEQVDDGRGGVVAVDAVRPAVGVRDVAGQHLGLQPPGWTSVEAREPQHGARAGIRAENSCSASSSIRPGPSDGWAGVSSSTIAPSGCDPYTEVEETSTARRGT